MKNSKGKKQVGVYFPADLLQEMQKECKRIDRSLSWLAIKSWEVSRGQIKALREPDDE